MNQNNISYDSFSAQKMNFSFKDFFSKCDQCKVSCFMFHDQWLVKNFNTFDVLP